VSDRERRADEAEGGCCETISSSATVRRSVRLRSMATARSVGMAIRPAAASVLTALFTRPPPYVVSRTAEGRINQTDDAAGPPAS